MTTLFGYSLLFLKDTPTPEIYTLAVRDVSPIWSGWSGGGRETRGVWARLGRLGEQGGSGRAGGGWWRVHSYTSATIWNCTTLGPNAPFSSSIYNVMEVDVSALHENLILSLLLCWCAEKRQR